MGAPVMGAPVNQGMSRGGPPPPPRMNRGPMTVAQPMAQPFMVQCPPGAGPGMQIMAVTPDGRQVMVVVPQGTPPGGTFPVFL